MVKRNTNFKQMFLADNTLIDVINLKYHSIYNKINNSPNKNQSCADCSNSKSFNKLPFPETIKDSNGNIDTIIRDESSSNSDSSSDDENGDNNQILDTQRMMQPSSSDNNIDNYYTSSNHRTPQHQPNGENVYNSLNQRIIHPLQNDLSSSSSNESDTDTDNLDRNQNFQNLDSRSELSPPINENNSSNDILPYPNNINQENSNVDIADSTETEIDITDNRDQIRQQNDDLSKDEEQFQEPLPEEQFMDINVPNISQPRRPVNKIKRSKRLKSKIRRKQEDALGKLRKARSPIKDHRTSQFHNERAMDEDEEMFSDIEQKHETIDKERKKRNRKDISNLSSIRKQQRRIEKMKMLKMKQKRLKQLYMENKNHKIKHPETKDEMEDFIDDQSSIYDDYEDNITKRPTIRLRKFAYGTIPQQENINNLDESITVDDKSNEYDENQTIDITRPKIKLRKFAYGTISKQENINKPEIRVAKFASQNKFKNEKNISNNLQYFCELCKIPFSRYSFLKQHLQENHEKKDYKIQFPDAGKYLAFARKIKHKNDGSKFFYENFNSNDRDNLDLTSYWCSKCQQFFPNFQALQKHSKDHDDGNIAVKRSITRDKVIRDRNKMFYKAY